MKKCKWDELNNPRFGSGKHAGEGEGVVDSALICASRRVADDESFATERETGR